MAVQLNPETDVQIIRRMADLIEKGSQGHSQATGYYWKDDGSVCAIGACLSAIGVTWKQTDKMGFSVLKALDLVTWPRVAYPPLDDSPFASDEVTAPLIDVIIWLNDKRGWDFAHIVLWLRSTAEAMETPESA